MPTKPPPPFNLDARPGLGPAVSAAYDAYCGLPTTDQSPGPSEYRAAEYRRIHDRFVTSGKYPTYRELWNKKEN